MPHQTARAYQQSSPPIVILWFLDLERLLKARFLPPILLPIRRRRRPSRRSIFRRVVVLRWLLRVICRLLHLVVIVLLRRAVVVIRSLASLRHGCGQSINRSVNRQFSSTRSVRVDEQQASKVPSWEKEKERGNSKFPWRHFVSTAA